MNPIQIINPLSKAVAAGAEYFLYKRVRRAFPWRDALVSMPFLVLYPLLAIAFRNPLGTLAWKVEGIALVPRWPSTWYINIICFVLVEFIYYWFHRLSHHASWFWADHSTHHSPRKICLLTGFRMGLTWPIAGMWIVMMPLVLIGAPFPAMASAHVAIVWYNYFLHSEMFGSMGFLEGVLNTPRNHCVHHGIDPPYLNKNFGGIFIVFDRIFGTYQAQDARYPLRYGVHGMPDYANPAKIVLWGWWQFFRGGWARLRLKSGHVA